MKPLNGFIKVKLIENSVSSGGILIPQTVQDAIWKAEVVDVGAGEWLRPNVSDHCDMKVIEGDIVYFRPASCLQTAPNSKVFLVHHDHLLGVE